MGAGKTTIGRQLASELSLDFFDSDHEIENRTGVTITHIFDIEGEAGFRKRETTVLDELTAKKGLVLATGGGAILKAAQLFISIPILRLLLNGLLKIATVLYYKRKTHSKNYKNYSIFAILFIVKQQISLLIPAKIAYVWH